MKRASVIVLVALLALMAVGPLGPASAAAASPAPPKVVLIVGPAGYATENYRRLANEAAVVALKYTPNVVKVYSPNATWPAVKQALKGASIVVYLGHGNGWPSRYRNELTPETQNGFGLNPNAGAGDVHQYFGEKRIAKEIKLAKNAVVIFSHLCYASGNSEPGLPEGTLDEGQQRVDNYAAGFIKAGAAAVIAEAYMGPAYYVRAILKGKGSVDRIWRNAPTFHGNLLRFASLRSKGYTAQMDTDHATSGFHRSIVLQPGLTAANVLGSAVRVSRTSDPVLEPTLAGLGIDFEAASLDAPPTASSVTNLAFKLHATDPTVVPSSLMVGVRWDPLEGATSVKAEEPRPASVPTPSATPAPTAKPTPTPAPTTPALTPGQPSPEPTSPPENAPAPLPSARPTAPPPPAVEPDPTALVTGEVLGEVVAPVKAKRTGDRVVVRVRVPSTPGLYRLVGTIHGKDGVAYDAATQAMMPALIVRVTGPLTAKYEAPETAFVTAGESFELTASVSNLSSTPWGRVAVDGRYGGAEAQPAERATFIARWVDLTGSSGKPAGEGSVVLPAALEPGARANAVFHLTAPAAPGDYLILLDVITPRIGSLAIAGVSPGIIRVTVSASAVPATP
jgi:hypothetical protein